jgi:hypothetical protein
MTGWCWTRQHEGGLIGTVRRRDTTPARFRAGTGGNFLEASFMSLRHAMDAADAAVRHRGHLCSKTCDVWIDDPLGNSF